MRLEVIQEYRLDFDGHPAVSTMLTSHHNVIPTGVRMHGARVLSRGGTTVWMELQAGVSGGWTRVWTTTLGEGSYSVDGLHVRFDAQERGPAIGTGTGTGTGPGRAGQRRVVSYRTVMLHTAPCRTVPYRAVPHQTIYAYLHMRVHMHAPTYLRTYEWTYVCTYVPLRLAGYT